MMRMLNQFFLILSVGLNMVLFALLTYNIADTNRRMVYNMDLVRKQYLTDVEYYYMNGCLEGTDYPPDDKMPTDQYNQNSPPAWCDRLVNAKRAFLEQGLESLGR